MTKHRHILLGIFALFIIFAGVYFAVDIRQESDLSVQIMPKSQELGNIGADVRDATFMFDDKPITLKDGVASEEIVPGGQSMAVTKYFGNEAKGDLNGDGREDVVLLLTRTMGGSGTFYYVAVALATDGGYVGSEAYLIGDRIAPQSTNIDRNGVILVNYADRKQGQPFSVPPSEGKTLRLKLDPETMRFAIVADGTGEADPSSMSLTMKSWSWQYTALKDDSKIVPKRQGKFTLKFDDSGRVSVGTDCNTAGGKYSALGKELHFDAFVSTEMFCAGSEEGLFVKELQSVFLYDFNDRGELILTLLDGESMHFK